MANVNVTSDAWTEISITSGTVQNISATADIELSAEQTDNSGVVLKPSELYQWDNETIYARSVTEETGALRVVNFKKAAGGGGGAGEKTPVGTIISFMGTSAPTDYLICDGTAYSISDYKKLSDHIAAQFGAVDFFGGDGVYTFAVPDLRGEFLRGTGTNSHEKQGSGANVGVHQDGTESPHAWANTDGTVTTYWACNVFDLTDPSVISESPVRKSNSVKNPDYALHTNNTKNIYNQSTTGYGTEDTIYPYRYTSRPTNTSVLFCIKYQ